jgi:putative NADH-flavin reductase
MKNIEKIAVLGGTGKAGKYLVKALLDQGYHLKLLLRDAEKSTIHSPLIEIVVGDARNYESILDLLDECQVVISTLGQPKGELSIFSQATQNILRAMNECHTQRYIVITGLNVDVLEDNKSSQTKFATEWMKNNYPETTFDKQLEYNILSQSNINWTMIRLPLIEQTDEKSKTIVSLNDCLGDKISANNLAYFIIEELSARRFIRKSPFLANG